MSKNPETLEEWQEAVDAAYFMLALDSCRQYGLITGGPTVNINRCEEVLNNGKNHGIYPNIQRPPIRRQG